VSGGKTDELRRSCGLVLRYAALLMFPMTALLIMCGPPLFGALQLGALDQAATASLAGCLAAYAVGLFAELSSPALAQALLVLGNRQAGWDGLRVLVVVGIFGSFIPNILFNLLLIGPFAEVGLAASTSLVAWLSLAVHYYLLRRTIGMHEESRCLKSVAGALLAACLAAGAGFTLLAGLERFDSPMLANGVVRATAAAFALLAVYVVLLFVYPGNDDARLVCRIVRDKLRSSSDRE
jgi:peptidoglycan biosynthesis protein MviN/MurJ (putative lipid II flippase)